MAVINLLEKIVFVLGILNIFFLILVLFSCKCMIGTFAGKLWKYKWYRKIYEFHGYYWWFFVISVFLHTIFAIGVYGNPL